MLCGQPCSGGYCLDKQNQPPHFCITLTALHTCRDGKGALKSQNVSDTHLFALCPHIGPGLRLGFGIHRGPSTSGELQLQGQRTAALTPASAPDTSLFLMTPGMAAAAEHRGESEKPGAMGGAHTTAGSGLKQRAWGHPYWVKKSRPWPRPGSFVN